MVIQIDSREKPKAITKILNTFQSEGVEVIRSKLPYGDYMSLDNARLVVDRKQNLLEVASNFGIDEKRFVSEMKNASKSCSWWSTDRTSRRLRMSHYGSTHG